MYPKIHIISGLIISYFIYLIFPEIGMINFLIIFISAFMIDLDHYLYYVFSKKDVNPFHTYSWFMENSQKSKFIPKDKRKEVYSGVYIFHGIEALILLVFLSFYNNIFFFIAIGFIIHQIFDLIEIYNKEYSYEKVLSFIYSLIRAKNKKHIRDYKVR